MRSTALTSPRGRTSCGWFRRGGLLRSDPCPSCPRTPHSKDSSFPTATGLSQTRPRTPSRLAWSTTSPGRTAGGVGLPVFCFARRRNTRIRSNPRGAATQRRQVPVVVDGRLLEGESRIEMTRYVGLIGFPLGHSLSPVFQQAAFDELG